MNARLVLSGLVAVLLAGCGGGSMQRSADQPQRLVRVDWYGAECFRIRSGLGIEVLTDPFSPGSTEFNQPKNLTPEVVLVSSERADANNMDLVENTPHILRGAVAIGTNTAGGIRILGVPVFQNPDTQDATGMTVLYRWTMDGLKFCFLGGLNNPPSPADLLRIGKVDVLFMPVSGVALTGAQRQQIISALRPQVIIPMGSLSAVSRFASGYTAVYRLSNSAALLSRESLPAVPTVLLFRAP